MAQRYNYISWLYQLKRKSKAVPAAARLSNWYFAGTPWKQKLREIQKDNAFLD